MWQIPSKPNRMARSGALAHDVGGELMIQDIHKLLKEVTAFISKLPEAKKAEMRRALVRNSRKTGKKRKP
jgi:hypothetical protein